MACQDYRLDNAVAASSRNEYKFGLSEPRAYVRDVHNADLARHLSAEELAFDGELKTPEQGAATSVWCATSPQLEGKGGVYCMDADIAEVISDFAPKKLSQQPTGALPWAIDTDLAERLWHLSEKMTGVKFSG